MSVTEEQMKEAIADWTAAMADCEQEAQKKDFRAFRRAVNRGERAFHQLREGLEAGLQHNSSTLSSSLETAARRWTEIGRQLAEWRKEVGQQLDKQERTQRNTRKLTAGYSSGKSPSGQNLRLRAN